MISVAHHLHNGEGVLKCEKLVLSVSQVSRVDRLQTQGGNPTSSASEEKSEPFCIILEPRFLVRVPALLLSAP